MVVHVLEVMEASEPARSAYVHVLNRPTVREVARNAICLLLWLDTTMGLDILSRVVSMSPDGVSLTGVVYEANAMYTYALHGYYALPPSVDGIPTLTALCDDGAAGQLVELRFFRFHRDLVARGVAMIRETIERLVFDERLHAMLHRFEDDCNSASIPNPVPAPELMEPFVVDETTPREDSRAAFLLFPGSHTLSSENIKSYFERTMELGDCVHRVAMEEPSSSAGQSPKHAIVVFRSRRLRNQAMFRDNVAFFKVDGHDMWMQPTCLRTKLLVSIAKSDRSSVFALPHG